MDLIPYSDSDKESNQSQDNDEIIEVIQKSIPTQQFNFGAKSIHKHTKNNKNISLDFGTESKSKSLFDSLSLPFETSLHHNVTKKKKKKKKKKRKLNDKKHKLEPVSLIDILPQPKHKKRKLFRSNTSQTTKQNKSDEIQTDEIQTDEIQTDEIQTNDIRKRQAEIHRKYTNPLATFSISNQNDNQNDNENDNEIEHNQFQSGNNNVNENVNSIGVQFQTASSIYRVDNNNDNNNNNNYNYNNYNEIEREIDRNNENENEEIINISHNDLMGNNNKKPWIRTFEIDDITRQEIKIVPTNIYNPKTGQVEKVNKYTKTQKRKHQINTLAYEAQEKALQLAMRKSSSYKTKTETQAKYGW